ncbi:MAG: hypothetical protein HRT47_00015 [Candidatus Caenarcaniphilales bacterium]|nr:hypothetical protein [Candidatus Caenarcaniphilales bacterium]
MRIFLLVFLSLIISSEVNADDHTPVKIENTDFYCNYGAQQHFLTRSVNDTNIKFSLRKATKLQKRQYKKLLSKEDLKESIESIQNCLLGAYFREVPSYEQVQIDCNDSFDIFDITPNQKRLSFDIQGDIAIANGLITGSIVRQVIRLIKNNPELKTIVMAFMPGSKNDDANLIAARLIHRAKISTCVPENGMIASGAVDFFLAGSTRSLADNSLVGVHSWQTSDGKLEGGDLPEDHKSHQQYLDYFKDIGFDENFYWFTLQAAPFDEIHNMTNEEREEWSMETKSN